MYIYDHLCTVIPNLSMKAEAPVVGVPAWRRRQQGQDPSVFQSSSALNRVGFHLYKNSTHIP